MARADTLKGAEASTRAGGFVAAMCVVGGVIALLPVYFWLPEGAQSLAYDGVAVVTAGVMFSAILARDPAPGSAWRLLTAGVAAWAVGDILYGTSQPVPSPADMFYVAAYPLLGLGLLAMWRDAPGRRVDWIVLDAALVGGGILGLACLLLLVPAGQLHGVELAGQVVSLAYPLMDLGLLALLIRAIRSEPTSRRPLVLLAVALGLHLLGDAGYAAEGFGSGYSVGNVTDAAFLVAYAFMAAAILDPALRSGGAARRRRRGGPMAVDGDRGLVIVHGAAPMPFLRFQRILKPVGAVLMAGAGIALFLGLAWMTPDLLLLAGAYGGTGLLTLIASA